MGNQIFNLKMKIILALLLFSLTTAYPQKQSCAAELEISRLEAEQG